MLDTRLSVCNLKYLIMLLGENGRSTYLLILEFLEKQAIIEPQMKQERLNLEGFGDILSLAEIVDQFMIKPNFQPEAIFDELVDAYNKKGGVLTFFQYRIILEKEKLCNFENLSFILKKRSAYQNKQIK